MNTNNSTKPNVFFWIIAVVALLWNLIGVMAFFTQAMNSETYRAQFSAEQLSIIDSLPLWFILVFAIAVFASTIACLLLIFRRKLAIPLFLIGLIAVIIQTGYNLFLNAGKEFYETSQYIMLISIPVISALLYWYSLKCDRNGWLK